MNSFKEDDRKISFEEFDEFLDDLSIEFFMTNPILDDEMGSGYVCIYLKTDDDEDIKPILKELNFKKIKNDFYYRSLSGFEEITKSSLDEIKRNYSDRMSQKIKAGEKLNCYQQLEAKWKKIAKKTSRINWFCLRDKRCNKQFFESSLHTGDIFFNLPNLLVQNENQLGRFSMDLHKFYEETKNIDEFNDDNLKVSLKACVNNHPFVKNLSSLRNLNCHNRPFKKRRNIYKNEENVRKILKDYGMPNPKNRYEYFSIQMGVLKELIRFLDKIFEDLTTKEEFE